MACSSFGKNPSGDRLKAIQMSPQYNSAEKSFVNVHHEAYKKMRDNISFWKILRQGFFSDRVSQPTKKMPEVPPQWEVFLRSSENIHFIWLGHSSFLVKMHNKVILFDPVFSDSAAPVSFFVRRFQPPVVRLEDLPPVDYIVISHDHYDHLDMKTIQFFKDRETKFLLPLGVGSHLEDWGIDSQRLVELDWWESWNDGEFEFVCTPSQHFSGRTFGSQNKTLWASWVVRGLQNSAAANQSLFYSGDTGYSEHFKEIGEKYGPFDLTFLENGQYNQMWSLSHMFPEEAVQAHLDLRGKAMVPVHWGMFDLAIHNWWDPAERVYKAAGEKNVNLLTPQIGQVVELGKEHSFEPWWKPLMTRLSSTLPRTVARHFHQK